MRKIFGRMRARAHLNKILQCAGVRVRIFKDLKKKFFVRVREHANTRARVFWNYARDRRTVPRGVFLLSYL